jgi:ribokinase
LKARNQPEALLAVVGAINWDVAIFEERFPRPGEEVPVRLVEEYPGGKGANVAVAAARVLGAGKVCIVGALGDDEVSEKQLSSLRAEGVLTDGVVSLKGRPSGRAHIIVDGHGMKTIHTHFGANGDLTPRHLTEGGGAKAIQRCSMLLVIDPPTAVARAAVGLARRQHSRVVYCPGVRVRDGLEETQGLIRASEVLVLDSSELRSLGKTEDEESALRTLGTAFPKVTVVTTLGARGCVVARGGVNARVEGVDLGRLGLEAVNSTGSGDAFLGVLASYLLMGRPMMEAAAWANLAGALKATRYETRGSPDAAELEASMKSLESVTRRRLGSRVSTAS